MNAILRYSLATLVAVGLMTAGPALASKAQSPAQLIVEDTANMFSDTAKQQAKSAVAGSKGDADRQVHLETYTSLSPAERSEFESIKGDKTAFWEKWAKSKTIGDKGILILVNRSPGHVHLLTDKTMRDRGFGHDKEQHIKSMLQDAFRSAKDSGKSESEQMATRDAALIAVADYLKAELPHSKNEQAKSEGSGIGRWICIGLCVLVGVWLIFGLIRAFSGGGGGGAGGGGGGGGFMSGLLGGLFGAMAGMWLYNNMFGGHSSAYGDSGGDYGGGDAAGDGDYSGDGGTGGDFDGGTGGDAGGGGGGDWGGGGGDF